MNTINLSLLLSLSTILIFTVSVSDSFADVISPKKQSLLNFSPDDIVCKEDLVKLFKSSNGNAACVGPSSAAKLVEFGWAFPLDDDMKSEITTKKSTPAGTIHSLKTLKQVGASGKLDSTPRINAYNYVFEACAEQKNIRAPEVVITTDSETKSIKLASMLKSGQCRTTSSVVKANDPQSISAVLLNKGGITKAINDMESNLNDLIMQLGQEKKLFAESAGDSKKTSEITQRITDLKKQINTQRYELQKYNLFLFSDAKKPTPMPALKSLTGKTIDGLSSDIISITKQVSQPKESERITNYNVVFEACTGSQIVKIPIVTITSDQEFKDVEIAEKISPNSCQMSVGKIFAKDSQSIKVTISSKQYVSSKISEIETSITELQQELDLANKSLEKLLTSNLAEPDLSKEVTKTTNMISDLRSKILVKKSEIASIMLQAYGK